VTPEELDAIEARAREARPGPWGFELAVDPIANDHPWVQLIAPGGEVIAGDIPHEETERDFAFIAHARTDIPALIAEVRRLREALMDAEQGLRMVVVRLMDGSYTAEDAERHGLKACQRRAFRIAHDMPPED
jgi:hypothetical protein